MTVPTATYRLQFNQHFSFADAMAIVPYLHALGISHVHASPYLKARAGSSHGYDVVDHNALNPEIGDEKSFDSFVEALHAHGMGQILDIVPNHMGVGGDDNLWWLDVLENGPASPYADYFDIDWHPVREALRERILLPLLGDRYGVVLSSGNLRLELDAERGSFSVRYYKHRFPVDPRTYPQILRWRIEELESEVGPECEGMVRLRNLISTCENLPPRHGLSTERRLERLRRVEFCKRQLVELLSLAPEVSAFLRDNVTQFNDVARPHEMKRTIPKTKMVCTIGPASESPEILKELILAGMSVARLNFSHGTQSEHAEKIRRIRDVSTNLGIPVCILQDLAGPKIRVGHIPDPGIRLEPGRKFVLTTEQLVGSEERVSVSYPHLSEDAKKGDRILLADGYMELKVNAVKAPEIHCEVLTGGILTSNKGISLPTSTIRTPAITSKDREDLLFGLEKGVDYVALSFVRKVEDVIKIKEIINHEGADVPVIAKIEKHEAIEHIQEIMRVADGIMVARGDLGVEIPLERVPVIQKQLIHRANLEGKPVITATQMLRSMVNSPRPTRAEAADVANAVLDGTDAVMLSEETASGDYPVEAVKYMARIAERAEAIFPHDKYLGEYLGLMPKNQVAESVAHATCVSAHRLGAAAIVAPTQSGQTARQISRFRPRCPIIALSPNPSTVQRLCLFAGCFPRLVPHARDTDDMIEKAAAAALETGRVSKGNIVIITAGHPAGAPGTTNMMQVKRL